jgi:hypothetical protein
MGSLRLTLLLCIIPGEAVGGHSSKNHAIINIPGLKLPLFEIIPETEILYCIVILKTFCWLLDEIVRAVSPRIRSYRCIIKILSNESLFLNYIEASFFLHNVIRNKYMRKKHKNNNK